MKHAVRLRGWLIGMVLVCVCGMESVRAQNRYPLGLEGIKAGSIPPPGLYLRLYNYFYQSDTLKGPDGNELPVGLDVTVYALAPRLLWVSEEKLLGADLGADLLVPLVWTDIKVDAAGIDDSGWSFGDIYFEPLLMAWHGQQYDAGFGISFFAPTAQADKPTDAGKEYWTTMLTLGGTWYADAEKTWSLSALGRYEIHGEKRGSDLTPGNDFHVEWGVGKTLAKTWDVGVAGYCQWQMTKDDGTGASQTKDRVCAIGPEVNYAMPRQGFFASLRWLVELEAKDRSEGNVAVLTLTKAL